MSKPECSNCRYWKEDRECRRRAPQTISYTNLVPEPFKGEVMLIESAGVTEWPMVEGGKWCGEWETNSDE